MMKISLLKVLAISCATLITYFEHKQHNFLGITVTLLLLFNELRENSRRMTNKDYKLEQYYISPLFLRTIMLFLLSIAFILFEITNALPLDVLPIIIGIFFLKQVQNNLKIQLITSRNFLLFIIGLLSIILYQNISYLEKQKPQTYIRSLVEGNNQTWPEVYDAGLTSSVHGDLIWTDWHDNIVSEWIRYIGFWEYEIGALFPHLFKPEQVVLCLGGHIGFHILQISELIGTAGKIYAFEANPVTYQILNANINLNNVTNVQLFNKAVYYQSGKIEFERLHNNTGGSFLNPNKTRFWGTESVELDTVTLDEMLKDVPSIDVIQMDIEGAEYWAMIGGEKLLKRSPNLTILTEWHQEIMRYVGSNPEVVYAYYTELGFSFIEVSKEKLKLLTKEEVLSNVQRDVILTKEPNKWEGLRLF